MVKGAYSWFSHGFRLISHINPWTFLLKNKYHGTYGSILLSATLPEKASYNPTSTRFRGSWLGRFTGVCCTQVQTAQFDNQSFITSLLILRTPRSPSNHGSTPIIIMHIVRLQIYMSICTCTCSTCRLLICDVRYASSWVKSISAATRLFRRLVNLFSIAS